MKIHDDEGVHVGWQPYAQFDLSAAEDTAFCIKGIQSDTSMVNFGKCIIMPGECDPCIRNQNFSGPDPQAPWFSLGADSGLDAIRLDPPVILDNEEYHYAFIDSNVYSDDGILERNIIDGLRYTYSVVAYDIGVPAAEITLTEYDTLIISSIEDPGNWSKQNPYSYLENSKGTTIHDSNFDSAIPGYIPEPQNTVKNVKVVPNPYIVHSYLNETEYIRRIRFTHLPKQCTIKIYTITGEFVFELKHDSITDGSEFWDLRTINNQEVSPGLYLYAVTEPGGDTFVDKFAIVR